VHVAFQVVFLSIERFGLPFAPFGLVAEPSPAGIEWRATDDDAHFLWDVQSLRRAGYEPCVIEYCNRRSDLRFRTTLDSTEEVGNCLNHLVANIEDAGICIEGTPH